MNITKPSTQSVVRDEASRDLDLVHASKNGDVGAFEQLVRRYQRRLLRIAQSVTRNREDSQDAVQEALLKAFQKLGEFREDAQFSTWLFRITVNQSLMKVRKQRTKREISLDESFGEDEGESSPNVRDPGPAPDQLCWASELRDIFAKTLQELRPRPRAVFILRDVEGLTIDQTAEALSVSKEAVKARLWRVRLQLRERLNRRLSERPGSARRNALPSDSGTHRIVGLLAEGLRTSLAEADSTTVTLGLGLSATAGLNNSFEHGLSA
jgi:RNA polymerase sigma-70 factor, ECF subfamily